MKTNDVLVRVELKSLKKGAFLHLVNNEDSPIWIRSDYDRSARRYYLQSYDDSSKYLLRKGNIKVYVDSCEFING